MAEYEAQPKHSSQGQLVIWDGMNLSTMFRFFAGRPDLHWSRAHRIATIPFVAAYNSVMGAVENLRYSRQIAQTQVEHAPIFILGYWRSGTTLLHNLMTLDPEHTFPNLYQCVFPWHFLTTEKVATACTGWLVPKSRPMDNIELSWDAPQEDDVALCSMTLLSPYTLIAWPRNMTAWKRSFEIEKLPAEDRRRWEEALVLLMKKITIRDNKRIVLKSPSHTYRVKTLLRLFPNAKFIFIHRHPYEVFNSAMHLRRTMVEENTLGRAVHPTLPESVIETFVQAYRMYENDLPLIPEGNVVEVRYESLANDPAGELGKIYSGLNLPGFDTVRDILAPQLPKLKKYKKNRFEADPQWEAEVYRQCREFFARFDYPAPATAATQSEPRRASVA